MVNQLAFYRKTNIHPSIPSVDPSSRRYTHMSMPIDAIGICMYIYILFYCTVVVLCHLFSSLMTSRKIDRASLG